MTKQPNSLPPLTEFALQEARPLPVFLLLDASGSMHEEQKIKTLNAAVHEMLQSLADEEQGRAAIVVGAVAFGGTARVHLPFMPVNDAIKSWQPLSADGNTPMGEVFRRCVATLEDRQLVPSRSYRPTLVLVSDGKPTDEWQSPLANLLASPRAGKAMRLAMAIGSDADESMLARFVNNTEYPVFHAHDARGIRKFFRWVTMSITARSRSTTPDRTTIVSIEDIDDISY